MSLRLGTMACLLASIIVVVANRAVAEPAPPRSRVALVRTASNDKLLKEATTRLRAELGDAGFDVVEVDQTPGDPRAGVEDAGGGGGGFATVSMNRAGAGAQADIWISDHVTGKTVVRRLEVGGAPNAAAVLAIRAMELLRASLLEVAEPEPTTAAPRAAPADVMKWVAPAKPAHIERQPFQGSALGVGAVALHGTGGVGFAYGPTLRFSHSIYGPWFGRISLAGPFVGPELTEPAGSASVRQEFASLDFGVTTRAKPIGAYGWVGLGAFHLHTSGSAAAPYRPQSDGVLSFLSMAGVGAVARASDTVAFTADFMALLLVPQPIVVIGEQEAGKAGAPSLALALGLLVGL
jgi:hypothetical protein